MKTYTVYHIFGIKVGCTTDYKRRCRANKRKYGKDIHIAKICEIPVNLVTKEEIGNIERYHAMRYGYEPGSHYRNVIEHTDEQRKKISEAGKNKVNCIDTRTNEHVQVSKEDFDKYDYYIGNTNGKVTCYDLRDGTNKSVSKEDFDKHDYYIGVASRYVSEESRKKISEARKGKITCYDLRDGTNKSVPTEDFYKYDYYVGPNSKIAKEHKKNKVQICN